MGKKGELYIQKIFTDLGFKCELNQDYERRYEFDLYVELGKLNFTIEVKNDEMATKTGNLAIEVNNCKSNKPSGIYSSSSDIWVHLIRPKGQTEIQAYAIKLEKLKCFAESTEPLKKIYGGGDDNADLLIYKSLDILPEFHRFDNISKPAAMKALFSELLCVP